MKEENEIDQLFEAGLNKSYAYDEQLWKQVEPQLPTNSANNPFWYFNLNSVPLFLIILCCAFIPTDTVKSLSAKPAEQLAKTEITSSKNINRSISINPKNNNKNSNQTVSLELVAPILSSNISKGRNKEEKPQPTKNSSLLKNVAESNSSEKKLDNFKQNAHRNTSNKSSFTTKNSVSSSSLKNESGFSIDQMNKLDYALFAFTATLEPFSKDNSDKFKDLQNKIRPKYYYLEVETYRSLDLSKKLNGENQQLIDYKNSTETPLYREGIGINILKDFKWLTLGVGLHYTRYYERANYSYDDEITSYESSFDTSYRVVDRNFISNGNPVFLIEENIDETVTENRVKTTKQLKVRNDFKRLQVPVIVGYQQNIGRWVAGIQTAFVFNYLTESNGVYVQDNLDSFKAFEESNQLSSLVFSQKNQLNLGFALNEFILIGGRFSHEYDINSFTKQYESKFQSYNLGVWLQWRP